MCLMVDNMGDTYRWSSIVAYVTLAAENPIISVDSMSDGNRTGEV